MGGENVRIGAAEAASALRWWLESGVDVAVQEEPRDWLAREDKPAETATPTAQSIEQQQLPETLDLFRDWLASAPDLPLAQGASRRVVPRGAEGAPVMVLADIPPREDSAEARPIGGDDWALTERMLAAIGIASEDAYVASLSCFHVAGARISEQDLEACAAIARRHVALARPKRLLLFGDAPARALLGKTVAAARGHAYKVEGVRTVATFHPRFLISRPSDKALAWRDLLLLMEEES